MEVGKYHSLGNGIQVRQSKNKDFTYYHSYRDKIDNKVKRKKLFTTHEANPKAYSNAILMANNVLESDVEEQEQKTIDKKYTLRSMKTFYFESKKEEKHQELKRRYKSLSLKQLLDSTIYKNKMQNTTKEVKRFDKAFLNSSIIDVDIRDIKRQDVKDVFNKEIHTLSEKSVSILLSMLVTIVNYSLKEDEDIDCKNPFQYVDLKLKNTNNKRTRYLSKDEITNLLIECKEYTKDKNVFNSVYLAILSGARKASILNITKKSINFDTKTLHLYNLKSEKYYSVVLNKEALNYFKNYLKDFDNDEYIIRPNDPRRRKKQPMRDVPKRVITIMDKMFNVGLNKQDNEQRNDVVNFHTLRRTVATNLALDNVSIYKIMRLLNHSTTKQTQDYLNLTDLNMSQDIENTHSNYYEYEKIQKETKESSLSALEYLSFLEKDDFSSLHDVSNFKKQIENWSFKLENEFDDNFTVDKFSTVEHLKHYLEYRNEFSTINEYYEEINLTI